MNKKWSEPTGLASPPIGAQDQFALVLADEFIRCGMTDALICPGSRSSPLALAFYGSEIRCHVRIDERSAGFIALGLAKSTGRAVAIMVTSGTALGNLMPAVLEASYARVPLIVLSADRPPELHDISAPQTCKQTDIFSSFTRWSFDSGVIRDDMASAFRSIASRAYLEAIGSPNGPGPVHINLPLTEPLVGQVYIDGHQPQATDTDWLPAARQDNKPWHRIAKPKSRVDSDLEELLGSIFASKGLIIAGAFQRSQQDRYIDCVNSLADKLNWPIITDPLSGVRRGSSHHIICHADSLLRSATFAEAAKPDVILRFGNPMASKVISNYIASQKCIQVSVDPYLTFADPGRSSELFIDCDPAYLLGINCGSPTSIEWPIMWSEYDRLAQTTIEAQLDSLQELSEPWIARYLIQKTSKDCAIFSSSSMAVRELEFYGGRSSDYPQVFSNRGLNGIDGVISTAIGTALSGQFSRVITLVGDIAFLHDFSSLIHSSDRLDLTLVVIDNGGGEIFEFLDQKRLDEDRFNTLFRTDQTLDLAKIAKGAATRVFAPTTKSEFENAWDACRLLQGLGIIICKIQAGSTRQLHELLESEISISLAGSLGSSY